MSADAKVDAAHVGAFYRALETEGDPAEVVYVHRAAS